MPYAVVAEKLKMLNSPYLQEAFNYIVYLQEKQDSLKNVADAERKEAVKIFKSFAGSLPKDFDAEKEKEEFFSEKYGVA